MAKLQNVFQDILVLIFNIDQLKNECIARD